MSKETQMRIRVVRVISAHILWLKRELLVTIQIPYNAKEVASVLLVGGVAGIAIGQMKSNSPQNVCWAAAKKISSTLVGVLLLVPLAALVPLDLLSNIPIEDGAAGGSMLLPAIYRHVYSRLWSQSLFLLAPFGAVVVYGTAFCLWHLLNLCSLVLLVPRRREGRGRGGTQADGKIQALFKWSWGIGVVCILLVHAGSGVIAHDLSIAVRIQGPSSSSSAAGGGIRSLQQVQQQEADHKALQRMPLAFALSATTSVLTDDVSTAETNTTPRETTSVVITMGDIYVTTLRFVLAGVGLDPEGKQVVHVDRQLFYYEWSKRKLQETFPHIPWPKRLMETPSAFTNTKQFADALISSKSSSAKKKKGRQFRLFVIDVPEISEESPMWKGPYQAVSRGWFYEVVQQYQCPSSLRRFVTDDIDDPAALGIAHINGVLEKGPLAEFRFLVGAPHLFLANVSNARLAARGYPWEAAVLELYHIAVRNQLLQAASDVQQCLGPYVIGGKGGSATNKGGPSLTSAQLSTVYDHLRSKVVSLLSPKVFRSSSVYDKVVTPFIRMLDSVISPS